MNEELMKRAEAVEEAGKARHGSNWAKFVSALGQRGVNQDQLAGVIAQPNAVDLIVAGGREAMIAIADDNHEMATEYAAIRQEERKKYRQSRGRS